MLYKIVKVSKESHARLTRIGKKNETYDDVIKKLLDAYEKASST